MQDYMKEIQLIVFYEATAFGGGRSLREALVKSPKKPSVRTVHRELFKHPSGFHAPVLSVKNIPRRRSSEGVNNLGPVNIALTGSKKKTKTFAANVTGEIQKTIYTLHYAQLDASIFYNRLSPPTSRQTL